MAAINAAVEGTQYRLRAGAPMPVYGGGFKLHTFKAERSKVYNYTCTNKLPGSEEFRGQGGTYMSAQFSRLNVAGGDHFQGKIVDNPTYIEEDSSELNFRLR